MDSFSRFRSRAGLFLSIYTPRRLRRWWHVGGWLSSKYHKQQETKKKKKEEVEQLARACLNGEEERGLFLSGDGRGRSVFWGGGADDPAVMRGQPGPLPGLPQRH